MPFDEESRSSNRPKAEAPNAPTAARAVRSLGRRSEDAPHVFLAQPADVPRTPQPAPAQPASPASAVLLRSAEPLSRDQLTATLTECPGALEDSMRVIDACIPCDPCGEIDLLAVDRVHRLTIIDLETTLGEWLLLRGISHVDWVARNLPNLRRMYPELRIEFSRPPRLLLIAPRFSPFLRSAVRQITQPEITCVRYHGLELSGGPGIFFEPISCEVE
jgi:hypothetical protein